jgi:hypothetical protein
MTPLALNGPENDDVSLGEGSRLSLKLVMTLLAALVAAILTFSHLDTRVSVEESNNKQQSQQIQDTNSRLLRIEEKLDRLIDRQTQLDSYDRQRR